MIAPQCIIEVYKDNNVATTMWILCRSHPTYNFIYCLPTCPKTTLSFSNDVTERASDIHFDPQEIKLKIRYRIDGVLITERTLPNHLQNVIIAKLKIMANLNITESRIPQDGRIKIEC